MNALLGMYENLGFEIFEKFSYQECRELLDIGSNARISPEDKLQKFENDKFNLWLNKVSYNKFKWQYMSEKINLWKIKDMSKKLLET